MSDRPWKEPPLRKGGLDRIMPLHKGMLLWFVLATLESAADTVSALATIMTAVSRGELTVMTIVEQ